MDYDCVLLLLCSILDVKFVFDLLLSWKNLAPHKICSFAVFSDSTCYWTLDADVLIFISSGIRDENDHAYHPNIVRIGLKAHHSVQAVSMDYLVSF